MWALLTPVDLILAEPIFVCLALVGTGCWACPSFWNGLQEEVILVRS